MEKGDVNRRAMANKQIILCIFQHALWRKEKEKVNDRHTWTYIQYEQHAYGKAEYLNPIQC